MLAGGRSAWTRVPTYQRATSVNQRIVTRGALFAMRLFAQVEAEGISK
jgi:hypothetical protein